MKTLQSTASSIEKSIFEDKSFVIKLITLLLLIIFLSSFVIFQGMNSIERLSFPFVSNTKSTLSLGSVEKDINGNSINLEIFEDDFSDLQELDLSEIDIPSIVQNKKEIVVAKEVQPVKKVIKQESVTPKIVASKPESKVVISTTKTQKHKSKKLYISSQNLKSLSFIKKKFYATNNIAFSTLLSRKFLEAKKYDKALKWALISNEINSQASESWILFAKAKLALNKPDDALNALNEYMKNNNSTRVMEFIKDIKSKYKG